MAQDNSATGGMLVIAGVVLALIIGYVLYQQGFLHRSQPGITVNIPAPSVTKNP